MRARSGWARALAMRASEVSPVGRAFGILGADLGIVNVQATPGSSRIPGRFVNVSSSSRALEVQQRELGRDRVLGGAVAAGGAFGGDRERLLVRLGQQLVELPERLVVELEGGAREHELRIVERAGVGGAGEVVDDFMETLAGQLSWAPG